MSARGVAWWAEQQRDVSMSSTTAVHYWSVDSEIGEADCVCVQVYQFSVLQTVYTYSAHVVSLTSPQHPHTSAYHKLISLHIDTLTY